MRDTKREMIRNKCNRGSLHNKLFGDKSWRDETEMICSCTEGKQINWSKDAEVRPRSRPKDVLNEDMGLVDVSKAVSLRQLLLLQLYKVSQSW